MAAKNPGQHRSQLRHLELHALQRVCGVCPLGEASCRRMGAVVMIFEVSICWCSTAVTAVGCSDALEPGGSRGVVFLPLWAVLVGYHSLSAEGVSVRWGSRKG